ncbi:cytochrome c [Vibrio sp. ABG19]|uniref:cytochrome c n=1 Tax=Vibrio sp. ABG19 TaxID=2817385 RepID=UPI00249E3AB9|nr:cytochrome c [Vibrio sp. ABG19]WGY44950.1 cytochrome c [Vibrio sp. ABG19]
MLKLKSGVLALMLALGCGSVYAATDVAAHGAADDALIQKGQYLAVASDCTACHTAHGGQPFAGGKVISSPVGDIIATNITPSNKDGIGSYSEQQFADALRKGVRADGAQLYPAMPYTAYATLTDEDIHALYTYFMSGVQAVDEPTAETELPFPLNIRTSMMVWNALFLKEPGYEADASQSASWNRGRYLVEGAAHCSTCHTPRGFLMQEQTDAAMTGAQVGPWFAPNITADPVSGIGEWSQQELKTYLRTGRLEGKAQAAGSMAEAITHSFRYLSDEDLSAIAEYMGSIADNTQVPSGPSRFNHGKQGHNLTAIRGVGFEEPVSDEGARLYSGNCSSCHGSSAQGTKDGFYPSLFHNSATAEHNPSNLIATILYGVERETAEGDVFMPPFGAQPNALNHLDDQQVAKLSNWILQQYGNQEVTVSPERVAEIRRGGPTSPLVLLAQLGVAAGVLVLLALVGWLIWRRKR